MLWKGAQFGAYHQPLLVDAFTVPGRSAQIQLKKRRSDYQEFGVYWPLNTGTDWVMEYFTNRLNTGNAGLPRRVCATLVSGTLGNFDQLGFPANPSNGGDLGTRVLAGTGNEELAISVRKPGSMVGTQEFVGGTHGHETDPTSLVVTADGVVINYAAAANDTVWTARQFVFTFQTTLLFPADDSQFATVNWVQTFDQDGYRVQQTVEYTADAIVHENYMYMLQTINRSGTSTLADNVGGGMDKLQVEVQGLYTLSSYNDAVTSITPRRGSAAFYNDDYATGGFTILSDGFDSEFSSPAFFTAVARSFAQDRSDGQTKFYNRLFGGDPTNGVTVASGAGYAAGCRFRVIKGNLATILAAQ